MAQQAPPHLPTHTPAHHVDPPHHVQGAPVEAGGDFFTNYGNYMPRLHCLQTEAGTPDWPWIVAIVGVTGVVLVGYVRIFLFWRRAYLAEASGDRNRKLMELAWVFLLCGTAGYGFSIVAFWWPAYRLMTVVLVALAALTWKFAWNLRGLGVSLEANRLQRELREHQDELAERAERAEALADQAQAERARAEAERERATAERERAQAAGERAETASRAKTAFLANMSHEIRTPMTAILGFGELLDDPDATPTERAEHVATIRRNGQHLLALVNDILDLSKIEAGKVELNAGPTDVVALATSVAASLRHRADRQRLALDVHVPAGDEGGSEPPALMLDETRLRQVIYNLLGNALKFTRAGGVTLAVHHRRDTGELLVEVSDTGIGIPDEVQPRLFKAFEQADDSTTREFGGTGLGLAIVDRLVRLMGGRVHLRSKVGEGTTVSLCIPVEVADGPATATTPEPAAQTPACDELPPTSEGGAGELAGRRLLLAEDGADNRRLVSTHLRRAGASVTLAEDGLQAVLAVRAADQSGRAFDAVLMDIQMPNLDGYAATARVKDLTPDTPVIALTAHAMADDRARCLDAGCDGYLSKPVTRQALVDELDQLLGISRRQAA